MLAQAISRTSPTAPSNSHKVDRYWPTCSCCSGISVTRRALLVAGTGAGQPGRDAIHLDLGGGQRDPRRQAPEHGIAGLAAVARFGDHAVDREPDLGTLGKVEAGGQDADDGEAVAKHPRLGPERAARVAAVVAPHQRIGHQHRTAFAALVGIEPAANAGCAPSNSNRSCETAATGMFSAVPARITASVPPKRYFASGENERLCAAQSRRSGPETLRRGPCWSLVHKVTMRSGSGKSSGAAARRGPGCTWPSPHQSPGPA